MDAIDRLGRKENIYRVLFDKMPCGLIVADEDGRIRAVNDVLERVIGITEKSILGLGSGSALRCLDAVENPEGCGSQENCQTCGTRTLIQKTISTNRPQKARVDLQVLIDGQVRDLSLLFNAIPYTSHAQRFAFLLIEDITNLKLYSPPDSGAGFRGLLGRDPQMLDLFNTIRDVAPTDTPVLVQGESGTGKELVALAIHKESVRARKHFVPVNCGVLPEGIVESELFGHVKGAFTGADRNRKGRFELAHGGTLFFDEVGELSRAVQTKLLRVLQGGCFERLGSEKTVSVNVRIISASNQKLEALVGKGLFREDLYYRLCVVPISVPPLRERRTDIPLLAEHYLTHYAKETLRPDMRLSTKALALMRTYLWPGNVRELQNALQFALIQCHSNEIRPEHLPPALGWGRFRPVTVRRRGGKLKAHEVAVAIEKAGGNRKRAAQILGVARSTLYRFLTSQKKA